MATKTKKRSKSKVQIVGMKSLEEEQESPLMHEVLAAGLSRLIGVYTDTSKDMVPARPKKSVSRIPKYLRQDLDEVARMLISASSMDSSVSEDIDPDEFLEYAREAVDNQNMPYVAASFKEFESLLEESIKSHFLDSSDDDDSLSSASSFSGYDHEIAANHSKRRPHKKRSSLISEVFSSRLNGQIARRKSNKTSRAGSSDCSYSTSTVTSSLFPSSLPRHIETEEEDEDSDESTSATTITSPSDVSSLPQRYKEDDASCSSSSDESTVATGTSKSTLTLATGTSKSTMETGASKRTRSSKLQMKRDPTAYLRRYEISEHNSLLSEHSYSPNQLHRQRRTRIDKRRTQQPKLDFSVDSEAAWDNIEQTADDLARVVMQDRNDDNHGGEQRERPTAASMIVDHILNGQKDEEEKSCNLDQQNSSPEPYNTTDCPPQLEFHHSMGYISSGTEEADFSHNSDGVDISNNSEPLHRSINIKIACATPDKVYEADKSHLVSPYDDDQVSSGIMDSKDVMSDISESFVNQSPANQRPPREKSSPLTDATATTDSSRRVSFAICDSSPSCGVNFSMSSPNISVDSGNMILPAVNEVDDDLVSPMESSQSQEDGWELDEMIESFLNHKIETLQERMVEQQMVLASREAVLKELKMNDGSIVQRARLKLAERAGQADDHMKTESDPVSHENRQDISHGDKTKTESFRSRSYWHERIRNSAERRSQISKVQALQRFGDTEVCESPIDLKDSSNKKSIQPLEVKKCASPSRDEGCCAPPKQEEWLIQNSVQPLEDHGCEPLQDEEDCRSPPPNERIDTSTQNSSCGKHDDLIRRVQAKREMIVKARNSSWGSPSHYHSPSSKQQNTVPPSPTEEEELLEKYLTRKSTEEPCEESAAKKEKLLNKARRRSILRSQKQQEQKSRDEELMIRPLQAPVSDSDESVPKQNVTSPQTSNCSSSLSSGGLATVKRGLRFGRKRVMESPSPYKALPSANGNNSFVAISEMDSESIIDAFAPPSPQSPIRDYCFEANLAESDTSDVYLSTLAAPNQEEAFGEACLTEPDTPDKFNQLPASPKEVVFGDISFSFDSPSFSTPAPAATSVADAFGDSFDAIVLRNTAKDNNATLDTWDAEDVMKAEILPTVVDDDDDDGFFDSFQPTSPSEFVTTKSNTKSSTNVSVLKGWEEEKQQQKQQQQRIIEDRESPTAVAGFFDSFPLTTTTEFESAKSTTSDYMTPKALPVGDGWVTLKEEEVSPTSVGGFFDSVGPIKQDSGKSIALASVDVDTPDPVFVDDDEFNQSAEEKSYQTMTGFIDRPLVEPHFVSYSRFEI